MAWQSKTWMHYQPSLSERYIICGRDHGPSCPICDMLIPRQPVKAVLSYDAKQLVLSAVGFLNAHRI